MVREENVHLKFVVKLLLFFVLLGSAVNSNLGTTNLHLDIASAVNVMVCMFVFHPAISFTPSPPPPLCSSQVYSSVPLSMEGRTRELIADVVATECCPETAQRLAETGVEVVS